MKYAALTVLLLASSAAWAGGTIGTNPGLTKEALELMSATVDLLPKEYVSPEDFRRTSSRLSVAGAETVPMSLAGETIQVRKLRNSIVDDKISKEILPSQ